MSPTGKYTTIAPFMLMVLVGMLKDFVVDMRQKRLDARENNRQVKVWSSRQKAWVHRRSRDLHVGNLLMLQNDVEAPADFVALAFAINAVAPEEPGFKKQVADVFFMNSATFDGESSLKIRKTALRLPAEIEHPNVLCSMTVEVHEEETVVGSLHFQRTIEAPFERVSIFKESFVARGCRLTNSRGPVIGIVIQVGERCLIRQSNRTALNLKQSVFEEHTLGRVLWFMVLFIATSCCISIVCFNTVDRPFKVFFGMRRSFYGFRAKENFIVPLGTFFILFSVTIPVSFYLLMGFMREIYAFILKRDKLLCCQTTGAPPTVKSPGLCCDLGAVRYLFTDKTGTLTKNKLSLRGMLLARGEAVSLHAFRKTFSTQNTFCLGLVCCHSLQVLPVSGKNTIIGSSMDELTILQEFLPQIDFINDKQICFVDGTMIDILDVIEFDSSQRKSTVILRMSTGGFALFCKGSESVIVPLFADAQSFAPFFQAYDRLSNGSYRCLVYGYKQLQDGEYAKWRTSRKSTEDLHALSQNMTLLGATLIEDELQADVPATIEFMKRAHIKPVIISGDKDGVTIATATKVRIVSPGQKLHPLVDLLEGRCDGFDAHEACITVDGPTVERIEEAADDGVRQSAIDFLCRRNVGAIICYRMTPAQKSAFVGWFMARFHNDPTVICAVGDGSNDVGMLRTAHIGIAIRTKEWADALAACDFGVYEFRHLKRLFFVHGHYNLYRLVLLLVGCFYKSFLLALCHVIFQLNSSFSSLCVFEVISYSTYNVIWSKITILYFAISSHDISEALLLADPLNYWNRNFLSIFKRLFLKAIAQSFWHAACVMMIPYYYFNNAGLTELTKNDNFDVYSFLTFTALIVLVNLRIFTMTSPKMWYIGLRIVSIPIALWFGFMYVYERVMHSLIFQSLTTIEAFFVIQLVVLSAFLPEIIESFCRYVGSTLS